MSNDNRIGTDNNNVFIGSTGNDTLNGLDGTDIADYSDFNTPITLERAGGIDKGNGDRDLIRSIEIIVGADGQQNAIDGSTGISGVTSFDVDLHEERLVVRDVPGLGDLNFTVENFVNVTGTSRADFVKGNNLDNLISGENSDDLLFGEDGDDTLLGDVGNDILSGGFGDDDTIFARAGNDIISGGNGNDELWGNDGNDTLEGGGGDDRLIGGAGSDTFVLAATDGGIDTIEDFEPGIDSIQLSNGLEFSGNIIF